MWVCRAGALQRLSFFFFNDTATTEIYTLSLHDALPILLLAKLYPQKPRVWGGAMGWQTCLNRVTTGRAPSWARDRKSTRLNSSHANISNAVFCLKKNQEKCAPAQPAAYTRAPTCPGA